MISKYNFNLGSTNRIKYIVIHYCGSEGSAESIAHYFRYGNKGASAHYIVGYDGEIYQSVEDKNVAWHCGAKTYKHPKCRNANSIGIEMCTKTPGSTKVADDKWYFEDATVKATIELTKELMKKYNVPAENVIRHYDVTGKTCPAPYVFNNGKHTWDEFKKALATEPLEQVTPVDIKKPVIDDTTVKADVKEIKSSTKTAKETKVTVDTAYLNIRKGPGANYPKTGQHTGKGIFTITEIQNGWGKLKSGAGWICLSYTKKV
jgi:N-acetylmuramoyl-L-alanine amidase CwlA